MNLFEKYLERAIQESISIYDEMFLEYKKYIRLATKDQTVEYLNSMEPARLQVIRETMKLLDNYFNKQDYQRFMKVITESLETLKQDIY